MPCRSPRPARSTRRRFGRAIRMFCAVGAARARSFAGKKPTSIAPASPSNAIFATSSSRRQSSRSSSSVLPPASHRIGPSAARIAEGASTRWLPPASAVISTRRDPLRAMALRSSTGPPTGSPSIAASPAKAQGALEVSISLCRWWGRKASGGRPAPPAPGRFRQSWKRGTARSLRPCSAATKSLSPAPSGEDGDLVRHAAAVLPGHRHPVGRAGSSNFSHLALRQFGAVILGDGDARSYGFDACTIDRSVAGFATGIARASRLA